MAVLSVNNKVLVAGVLQAWSLREEARGHPVLDTDEPIRGVCGTSEPISKVGGAFVRT